MNFRQIDVFRAVMTSGTASAAAEVLGISQPAVSKTIQELERSVAFALLHRIKGRIVPTAEARLLLKEVELSFVGLAHLRGAAARIRDFGSGEVRIACLSALSTNVLPRALKAFLVRNPNVAVTFLARMSSVVRELVAYGQFDLGIAADEIDQTGLDVRPFASYRVAVALSNGHALERLDVIRPADLQDQPFIALAPEDTTRREAEQAFADAGVSVKTVLETPYSTTVCAMVAAGIGVGPVNAQKAEPYLGQGLTLRPFEPALHFRTLLIQPPNRQPSRLVKGSCAGRRHGLQHRAVERANRRLPP
jgi:DNA-binding transcriptional LysR family regulator